MVHLFRRATGRRVCFPRGPERIGEGHVSTMTQMREAVTFSTPPSEAAGIDGWGVPGGKAVSPRAGQSSRNREPPQSGVFGTRIVRQSTASACRERANPTELRADASNTGRMARLTPSREMCAGASPRNMTQVRLGAFAWRPTPAKSCAASNSIRGHDRSRSIRVNRISRT